MNDSVPHIAFCPHCGNTAPQKVVHTHRYRSERYSPEGKKANDPGPDMEALLCVCQTCDDVLLYDGACQWEVEGWPSLVYPTAAQLPESIPRSVREAYAEAAAVKAKAPNAYAVMIRRALEGLCEDRGLSNGPLAKRLESLADRGEVPPPIAEATDILRVVGNAGAHHSKNAVTVPMTWAMDELFRVVVEYVYVAPSKLAAFREAASRASGQQGSV